MAVTKVDARAWTVEKKTSSGPDVWTEIGGINSFAIEHSEVETDTTDFDSAGIEEHRVMQRGKQISLQGFRLEDTATAARDAGQSAAEAAAALVGEASVSDYRFTSPGGTVKTAKFSTRLGSIGGGNNDKTSFAVTLKRSGAES